MRPSHWERRLPDVGDLGPAEPTVAFDPYLYLAFGMGLVAGWIVRPKSPWVPRATLVTIVVLVGLLGASLTGIAPGALLDTIPLALGLAFLILGLTAVFFLALAHLRAPRESPPVPGQRDERFPLSLGLLAALVGGYLLGRSITVPTESAIPLALYALLALVGFDLKFRWKRLPSVWVPLAAAVSGAVVAAIVFTLVARTAFPVALATTMAFGFYTLAGPLVAARAGALLGLLAFLTNFLREDLTMLLAPAAGPRLEGEGLAALGGATAMDTTLYFVTRYGDREAGSVAIASGLVLTIVASLVLPALLALPV